jgi:dihydrofolate reductase
VTRTTYYTATTLDGFIADAQDSLSWLFVHDQDHAGPLNYDDFIARVGALVMGSTTYEWVRRHVEDSDESWPYDLPTWVTTTRDLPGIDGADVRFVRGEVTEIHREAAQAAGGADVWVVGGGDLAGQFADVGLLDEVIVYVAPVVLGEGRPLLPRRLALTLEETARNGDFVTARYSVLGRGDWPEQPPPTLTP